MKFDGKTMIAAGVNVVETSRHGLSHCETTALLEFDDLPKLVENISREHVVILYGDHLHELEILSAVLGTNFICC